MTSRIGVMGGMFDPVHQGHRAVALAALEKLRLDQLRIIPCGIPNHREKPQCTSTQRLEMLRLATHDVSKIVIDSREIDRQGVSYSYDTVASLRHENESALLFFVMGLDALNSLPQWHRWQELIELCHLAVFSRPGNQVDDSATIELDLEKRQVFSVQEFDQHPAGKIIIFEDLEIKASSSLVKECLLRHQPIDELLASEVADYISEHGLYEQLDNS